MRHYTLTFLVLPVILVTFTGCLSANAKEYKLYTDCDEYYDSRGFYHKTCDKNSFSKKEALRTYTYALETVEPGKGEQNKTDEQLPPTTGATLPIVDTIDDEEETPDKEKEDEASKKIRALSENLNLEFGRE